MMALWSWRWSRLEHEYFRLTSQAQQTSKKHSTCTKEAICKHPCSPARHREQAPVKMISNNHCTSLKCSSVSLTTTILVLTLSLLVEVFYLYFSIFHFLNTGVDFGWILFGESLLLAKKSLITPASAFRRHKSLLPSSASYLVFSLRGLQSLWGLGRGVRLSEELWAAFEWRLQFDAKVNYERVRELQGGAGLSGEDEAVAKDYRRVWALLWHCAFGWILGWEAGPD